MRLLKLLLILVIVGLMAGATSWYFNHDNAAAAAEYRTAPVTRGDLVATIGATGTVEPEEAIDVGAQVAGQIVEFGKDKSGKDVDYGSTVEEGQLLAKIDPAIYEAAVTEAEAQLQQSKASVTRAMADLEVAKSKRDQASRDWDRAQKIGPSDALAQSAYDNYRAVFEQAKANVGVSEAAIEQAKASVAQAQSALDRANRNLGFTTIKSPVTGVIIDRRVNIGQTVVASLNAPSLFLLAKDLQRMEVWVAVNEADIGNIHQDQPVSFTVDAFPGHTFHGAVAKIRLNASMTQNVVTYTVEVSADNAEKLLLPYLTANVQFEVSRSDNAMLVPNAALRYTPADEQVSPAAKEEMNRPTSRPAGEASSSGGEQRQGRRRRDGAGGAGGAGATSRPSRSGSSGDRWRPGTVWVRDGQFLKPLKVRAGTTDGAQTEIMGQDVTEGMEVVVGQVAQQGSQARGAGGGQQQSANPFIPQFPSRGGRGSRGG
jgi:HlyD family secretion protein